MTDVNAYDEELEGLARLLDGLDGSRQAAFFWLVASALLPLYDAFSARHERGDPEVVRAVLGTARAAFAEGHGIDDVQGKLDALLIETPHGDDVDGIDATFAQDVTICADAALRAAAGLDVDGDWIGYAVEPWLATSTRTAMASRAPRPSSPSMPPHVSQSKTRSRSATSRSSDSPTGANRPL